MSTCLAIALGTAFITGTNLLSVDLRSSVDTAVQRTYERYDAVVQSAEVQSAAFGQELRGEVAADVVDRVAAVDGVAEAAGVVESTSAQVFGHRGGLPNRRPPTVVLNWVGGALQQGDIVSGRPPQNDAEVVLDVETATIVGFRMGGTVVVIGADGRREFELVGLLGLSDDPGRSGRGPTVVVTTPVAQQYARLDGAYSYVAAAAGDDVQADALVDRIRAQIPEHEVLSGADYTAQRADSFGWLSGAIAGFVTIFGLISLFVAAFIVHNTFSILVAQRTRETALMRAVGAEPRQVLVASLLEAAIVGVVASLVGLAAGVVLARILKSFVSELFSVQPDAPALSPTSVAVAIGVGVAVSLMSAAVPAWRASRVPPAAAMTDAELAPAITSGSRGLAGGLLFATGVVFVALGVAGVAGYGPLLFGVGAALVVVASSLLMPHAAATASRLLAAPFVWLGSMTARVAGENAARNPRRTAVAAVSLTIGVMLVTLIAVVASSVRASVHDVVADRVSADFVARTSSFASGFGVSSDQLAAIESIAAVEVASPVRFGGARVLEPSSVPEGQGPPLDGLSGEAPVGDDVAVLGIDPATFFQLVDPGTVRGSPDALVAGTFAATERVAEREGWSPGDRVDFYFPRTGVQRLELASVVETDFAQAGYLLPRATFDEHMLPTFAYDAMVLIGADPGASGAELATLRSDLREVFTGYPNLAVEDLPEFIESRTVPLDTFLSAVYGLLALSVVIALVGIANTLSLSVLERRREMGVMRALGMTRGQLRRTVLVESSIIAAMGTLLGLAIGLALSWALVSVLSSDAAGAIPWSPPMRLLAVVGLVAALAGVLAAVLPAWRASRSEALDAIASV